MTLIFLWMHRMDTNKTHGEKAWWNYSIMLRAVFNKSEKQHPTKWLLYSHLLLISQIIQVRRARYAEHSWASKIELISDVFSMESYTWRRQCWPLSKDLHQLYADNRYRLEDLMWYSWERERERERERKSVRLDDNDDDVTWQKMLLYLVIHLWTPTHGHARVGLSGKAYISADIGCSQEDLSIGNT